MRILILVVVFIFLQGCASNQNLEVDLVECKILKQGIYSNEKFDGSYANSNTTSGHVQTFTKPRIVKETSRVPLMPNMHFGVIYRFNGLSSSEMITEKVTHPKFSKPGYEPSTGYEREKKVGLGSGYVLNRSYELVEGEWKLEYFYQGKRLCGATFYTYKT